MIVQQKTIRMRNYWSKLIKLQCAHRRFLHPLPSYYGPVAPVPGFEPPVCPERTDVNVAVVDDDDDDDDGETRALLFPDVIEV
jgi:hypothetical protein